MRPRRHSDLLSTTQLEVATISHNPTIPSTKKIMLRIKPRREETSASVAETKPEPVDKKRLQRFKSNKIQAQEGKKRTWPDAILPPSPRAQNHDLQICLSAHETNATFRDPLKNSQRSYHATIHLLQGLYIWCMCSRARMSAVMGCHLAFCLQGVKRRVHSPEPKHLAWDEGRKDFLGCRSHCGVY